MKNLELHAQESAKYWVMSNINNADFRSKYFPQKLDICEENFLNRKVWSGGENLTASCDANDKKDGNYSLKMDSSKGFSNVEFYTPLISVTPNTQYKLSYWVKTKDIVKADSNTQTMGKVYPALYKSTAKEGDEVNASNRISSGFNIGPNLTGTNDWVFKETLFITTADTAYLRLRVQPGNAGKGIIWVDNVKLEPLGPAPSINPTITPIVTISPTLIPTKIPTSTPTSSPVTTGGICGYIKNSSGGGIGGVTITIYKNVNNVGSSQNVITDSSGFFNLNNFVPKMAAYAVRPQGVPAGYTGPVKTTTSGWTWQIPKGPDTPLSSTSYENQQLGNANGDCASSWGGTSCRCNFKYGCASIANPASVACDYVNNKITWPAVAGVSRYPLRVDANPDSWNANSCATINPGDVCEDVSTNSKSFTFADNVTYHVWVHSISACDGSWGTGPYAEATCLKSASSITPIVTVSPTLVPTNGPTKVPTSTPVPTPVASGTVCGYIKDSAGVGIAGVAVQIQKSVNNINTFENVTTNSAGYFVSSKSFVPNLAAYAVRPQGAPVKTTTNIGAWMIWNGPNTPLNSTSYENQQLGNANGDCASSWGGTSCRCNFKF